MPKLVITIEEKEEKTEDGGCFIGYGVWIQAEPEIDQESFLHAMGPVIQDMVTRFICEAHTLNGAQESEMSMHDASESFELLMAEATAKAANPFPTNL